MRMNLIGFVNDKDIQADKVPAEFSTWNVRIAVRAVLQNEDGKVALMHIGERDMYKLPGGGVNQEEDLAGAFTREMKEETGCETEATADLGVFVERRDEWEMVQISFCYMAKVIQEGKPDLTEKEKEEGFCLQWHTIDKALTLISKAKSDRYDDRCIRVRDFQILQAGKKLLGSK